MPPNNTFKDLADGVMDAVVNTFDTEAIYIPKLGGRFTIVGPFDDRVQEVDPDTEIPISSNVFTFGLQLKQIPNLPEKGDKLIIDRVNYKVIDSQEDGVPGVSVVLILHKVF